MYLLVTIAVAALGCTYELFSHGVWSVFMVYAFVFPLVLGALPFFWLTLKRHPLPRMWVCRLHHAGVATLTVGSVMEGAFAIYGTTNMLTLVYWIVGAALLILAQIIRFIRQ